MTTSMIDCWTENTSSELLNAFVSSTEKCQNSQAVTMDTDHQSLFLIRLTIENGRVKFQTLRNIISEYCDHATGVRTLAKAFTIRTSKFPTLVSLPCIVK